MTELNRTKANPWQLKTAPGTAGKTVLYYDARCVADLHTMLKAADAPGGWG